MVCREMDCGDPAAAQGSSRFGQGSEIRGYTVSCVGRESSLKQCTLSEFPKTSHDGVGEATVVCSGKTSESLKVGMGNVGECTQQLSIFTCDSQVMSSWSMGLVHVLEEWSSTMTVSGELCVVIPGT